MNDEPRLTAAQEARFRVLDRMRHDRWCTWKAERDCNCKAGRLMLALIEAERGSGADDVREAQELADSWGDDVNDRSGGSA